MEQYQNLFDNARNKPKNLEQSKQDIIKELAIALEKGGMPTDMISARIIEELRGYASKQYIEKCLEEKYIKKYQKNGQVNKTTSSLNDSKNVPEQTVQVASTGEETYETPEPEPPKPAAEVKRLQTELENKNKELEEAKKKAAILQEAQNIEDIPQLVDNKIGPTKIQNVSKLNQYDRRGYQILASRFGELLRRKLANDGKASIKFYVIAKDRTTNIEYMVPISFTVNMLDKSTDMVLDESRL
jgi:hypothetical protein